MSFTTTKRQLLKLWLECPVIQFWKVDGIIDELVNNKHIRRAY
jgi:hypothetical protein